MKKLLFILSLFVSFVVSAQDTIKYTPMGAAGYRFKYIILDSGLAIPFRDTTTARGTTRPGPIVINSADNKFYFWNGVQWVSPSSGTITNPSPGVDSAVITFTSICIWMNGEVKCLDLTQTVVNANLNADSSLYIFKNANGDSVFALPTLIKHVFGGPNINVTERNDSIIISGTAGINNGNGLISGGIVSWSGTGLVYDITPATYVINNVQYSSPASSVTLDASDPSNDRVDVIKLNTSSAVGVETGTASANPVTPQVDPATEIELTSIIVTAASTVPSGVTQTVIYDENTEWTHTISTAFTVDFDNSTNVFHGSKAVNVSSTTASKNLTFTNIAKLDRTNYSLLKMYIKLKAPLPSTANIQVYFRDATTSRTAVVSMGAAQGFDKSLTSYQNVTLLLSSLAFNSNVFDNIIIQVTGVSSGFYLDWVQLQGGVSQSTGNYMVDIFRKAGTDSVFKNIAGVVTLAYRDSVGSGGGSQNLQQVSNIGNTTTRFLNLSGIDVNAAVGKVNFNVDSANLVNASGYQATINFDRTGGDLTLQSSVSSVTAGGSPSFGTVPLRIKPSGLLNLGNYGGNFFTGTPAYDLSVATGGNLITMPLLSLTTTGSSGAATFNSTTRVLNVPQYSGGSGGVSKAYAPFQISASGDSISYKYTVEASGAIPNDGIDDTRAIQATINAADSVGHGATVYFKNGEYTISGPLRSDCNCQIKIPYRSVTDTLRTRITLQGESFGIDPVSGGYVLGGPLEKTGARLVSTLTAGAANSAVIASENSGGGFNGTSLQINNLTVVVKNNPAGAGPVVGGISYKYGTAMDLNNVFAIIDTAGFVSTRPTNDVVGIETPDNQATSFNTLQNTLAVGFKDGYKLGEHTVLIQAQAFCCYHGINIKNGSNPVYSLRASAYWCAYNLYVSGASTLANFQLSATWQQIGKWYDEVATVRDSSNLAAGQIFYTLDGGNNSNFTKSGGSSINCMTNAEGIHPIIGQSVGSGTAGSVLYAGASNVLAQDNSKFFYDYNNHRLGIGTTSPTVDLEVSNISPGIKVNRTTSTGAPGYFYTDRGTNKFVTGIDHAGNGTADWYFYDYANSRNRMIISTAGDFSLGGDAASAPGMTLTSTGNVGFNNNALYFNSTTNRLSLGFGTAPTKKLTISGAILADTIFGNAGTGKLLIGTGAAYDLTNDRLGIGTTSPGVNIEISAASPGIKLNRSTSNGAPGYFLTSQGTNKFVTGIDHLGNGTSDFYIYNYAASKNQFLINPTGDITMGGDAAAAPTLTLSVGGGIALQATNISAGTTGAQTINKPSGTVNFAAGASTLVVTNSLATTTSTIHVTVYGTDVTATSARVTRASGSFTITLNATATAETAVGFIVIN